MCTDKEKKTQGKKEEKNKMRNKKEKKKEKKAMTEYIQSSCKMLGIQRAPQFNL